MPRVELEIPDGIVEALPEDGEHARRDMQKAVSGWERRINQLLVEDAGSLVDVIDRFEDRWERYDDLVVELRAWGQSPIYAMAWRDLHESLIQQLLSDDELEDQVDRERHARLVENGIRFQD